MLPETLAAFHATCQSDACLPTKSIGIELVNLGHVNPEAFNGPVYEDPLRSFNYPYWEDYPPSQRHALKILVEDITARWGIPLDQEHALGHFQLNHKTDPGPALNLWWDRPGDLMPPLFDGN
jgi:N-acetyl-anhydromuramyl-L-alanine amidase AmpD